VAASLVHAAEEFPPAVIFDATEKYRAGHDEREKNQGVEGGDQDAPFAHGAFFGRFCVYHRNEARGRIEW
jgi:hypothetical protein